MAIKGVNRVRDGAGAVRQGGGDPGPRPGHPRAAPLAAARVQLRDPRPHGRRAGQGLPRLPRAAQRRARPLEGRHPLPPAGDARHRPRPRHLDDLEVRGRGHPARRRQGRRHLRPPPPLAARAGADLPRLGAPARPERRARRRRARPRRHDLRPAHALDARRVRDDPRRPLPRLHHRQARGHGRLRGPHRGHRLRRRLHDPRGAAGDGDRRADRPAPASRASATSPSTRSGSTRRSAGRSPASPAGTRPTRRPTPSAASPASTRTSSSRSPTASAASTRPRRRSSATRSCPATPGSSSRSRS